MLAGQEKVQTDPALPCSALPSLPGAARCFLRFL